MYSPVTKVESDEDVTEAVPGLLPGKDGDRHEVAEDAHQSNHQGGGKVEVGELREENLVVNNQNLHIRTGGNTLN